MDIFKMPSMKKSEYDTLIEDSYICRIAFKGESHPYIAPFLYVFDGKFMYFLSTGRDPWMGCSYWTPLGDKDFMSMIQEKAFYRK